MAVKTSPAISGAVRIKGGTRRYVAGQEEDFKKVATKEEIAHLTKMGAISGFDTEVKEEEVAKNLGPTALTATKADKGALRKGGQNDEANVRLGNVAGNTGNPSPASSEEELDLQDMSRKQLLSKAEATGVDLATVEGSGKEGYVTMEDLIRAIEAKQAETPPT